MSVRSDGAMDNLTITDDDDFDALLDASSLGAPHITAERGPMPEPMRRRFCHAARHPEVYDEFGLPGPAVPRRDESDATCAEVPQRGSATAADAKTRGRRQVLVIHPQGSGKITASLKLIQEIRPSEKPVNLAPWGISVLNGQQRSRRLATLAQLISSIEQGFLRHEMTAAQAALLNWKAALRIKATMESSSSVRNFTSKYVEALLGGCAGHSTPAHLYPHVGDAKTRLARLISFGVLTGHEIKSPCLHQVGQGKAAHWAALMEMLVARLSAQSDLDAVPATAWNRNTLRAQEWMTGQVLRADAGMRENRCTPVVDTLLDLAARPAIEAPWPWLPQALNVGKSRLLAVSLDSHAVQKTENSWAQDPLRALVDIDCESQYVPHRESPSVKESWTPGDETVLHSMEALNAVFGRTSTAHPAFLRQMAALKASLLHTAQDQHQNPQAFLLADGMNPSDAEGNSTTSRRQASIRKLMPNGRKTSSMRLLRSPLDAESHQQEKLCKEGEGRSAVLNAEIPGRLHSIASDHTVPLYTRLTYRTSDPYAIEAVFLAERGPVVWVFARDLLSEGLERSAGAGDVIIWSESSGTGAGAGTTFIKLNPPNGTAQVAMPREHVQEFMNQTKVMVPVGSEHEHHYVKFHDLEAELSQLARFSGGMF
ncbi:SsgA family sporulation/cell division regulator [Streptomyces angustmyceticus]|uniref:SsgA family sporulation/cell division regulator n=1 Tax=Streptomyces angustmyceticus TaxID=285578 RepID=UPI0021AFE2DE|nr:SsgA family sporulation/cell division regulator [Streptomyces angustmyceticus]